MAASPNELVRALEGNLWSFGRNLGSGPGGRVVDTETRLVVHTPVPNPPYNGIWRFGDEGGASLLEQAAPTCFTPHRLHALSTNDFAIARSLPSACWPTLERRISDALSAHQASVRVLGFATAATTASADSSGQVTERPLHRLDERRPEARRVRVRVDDGGGTVMRGALEQVGACSASAAIRDEDIAARLPCPWR